MDTAIEALPGRFMRGAPAVLVAALACACAAPPPDNTPTFVMPPDGGPSTSSNHGAGSGSATEPGIDGGSVPSGDDGSTGPAPTADSGTAGPAPGADAAPPGPPSNYQVAKTFVGSYAGLIKFNKLVSIGSFGSFHTVASIYATMQIKDDPANQAVMLSSQPCRVLLAGMGTGLLNGAMLTIPDKVMTTTHLDDVPFSASQSGGMVTWSTTEVHGPIGWKWSSPSDALPTSASDPKVFDQDGDGHPGVTMTVAGGGATANVYFAQVQRDTLSGTASKAGGTLTGLPVDNSNQSFLGSDNPLIAGAVIMWMADTTMADDLVKVVPVSSALTCDQLVAQIGTLFP
jgi:hypothetical protein